jgi:hypothetical protein
MLLGRARDGSVRVSESEGERIDAGQRAWQQIVTCLAVFFLPKIEPGRLPMLDPVVAPPMLMHTTDVTQMGEETPPANSMLTFLERL